AGNFTAQGFADLFLEGEILPGHAQLQIQMPVIETADLDGHFRAAHALRSFAIPGHALHELSSMLRFNLSMGTATVPTSSPTKPAAILASTAASANPAPPASASAQTATTVSPAPVTSKTSRASVGKCFA